MSTADWPFPPVGEGLTVHAIGDVHATPNLASYYGRLARVGDDSTSPAMRAYAACHVQIGDCINNNSTASDPSLPTEQAEDQAVARWVDQWFTSPGGPPYYQLCGNHDIAGNLRSGGEWAAQVGLPALQQSYYVGSGPWRMRLLLLSPDLLYGANLNAYGQPSITLSSGTVNWLRFQMQADPTTPTWLFCHAPLPGTTTGTSASVHTQDEVNPATVAGSASDVKAIIAAYPSIVGWIAGHTHFDYQNPTIMQTITLGGVSRAAVDCSTLAPRVGTASDNTPNSPFWQQYYNGPWVTPYITWLGDRVEVRWRDHGARRWHADGTTAVTVLPVG